MQVAQRIKSWLLSLHHAYQVSSLRWLEQDLRERMDRKELLISEATELHVAKAALGRADPALQAYRRALRLEHFDLYLQWVAVQLDLAALTKPADATQPAGSQP